MSDEEDLAKLFDADYVAKFQKMQQDRIDKEHADDAARIQRLKEEEDFRISAVNRAKEAINLMVGEYRKTTRNTVQPMHDLLVEMGARCKCDHKDYDYYD